MNVPDATELAKMIHRLFSILYHNNQLVRVSRGRGGTRGVGRPLPPHRGHSGRDTAPTEEAGLPHLGAAGPGVGGRSSPLIKVSGTERGVGGLGQASHPRPRTAKCVSWMGIQGNCASPHSACSEANAFLSYCLCRRLVVGTPIISSLGERPRCSQAGCGRPESSAGDRLPGGRILESPGAGPQGTGTPPKASQDVSWLVAGDATLWEGKEGADGRTCGAASLRGRGASPGDGHVLPFPGRGSANLRRAGRPTPTTPAHRRHRVSTL